MVVLQHGRPSISSRDHQGYWRRDALLLTRTVSRRSETTPHGPESSLVIRRPRRAGDECPLHACNWQDRTIRGLK